LAQVLALVALESPRSRLSDCLRIMRAAALVLAASLVLPAAANELTKETWDDAVAGKTVFVKFQAPW